MYLIDFKEGIVNPFSYIKNGKAINVNRHKRKYKDLLKPALGLAAIGGLGLLNRKRISELIAKRFAKPQSHIGNKLAEIVNGKVPSDNVVSTIQTELTNVGKEVGVNPASISKPFIKQELQTVTETAKKQPIIPVVESKPIVEELQQITRKRTSKSLGKRSKSNKKAKSFGKLETANQSNVGKGKRRKRGFSKKLEPQITEDPWNIDIKPKSDIKVKLSEVTKELLLLPELTPSTVIDNRKLNLKRTITNVKSSKSFKSLKAGRRKLAIAKKANHQTERNKLKKTMEAEDIIKESSIPTIKQKLITIKGSTSTPQYRRPQSKNSNIKRNFKTTLNKPKQTTDLAFINNNKDLESISDSELLIQAAKKMIKEERGNVPTLNKEIRKARKNIAKKKQQVSLRAKGKLVDFDITNPTHITTLLHIKQNNIPNNIFILPE